MLSLVFLLSCSSILNLKLVSAQYAPDAKAATVRELEHLYLDAAPNGLLSAITPCSNYFDPSTGSSNNGLGRQTAAEWIRVAFHDFVTANIYSQTGGLDASIGFETDRHENVGPAFADSLTFFSFFFSSKVSMSDLIALGTVLATSACGGPHVSFRGGRTDAKAAGPSGVPEPETNLQTTLNQFGNAGFNTDDTIILTACGHSVGGVHKAQFSQVTDNTAGTQEGSDGRIAFDETVATFDTGTASDYVQSTGAQGGPLVTTTNTTVNSDLRLYEADQNATIGRLAQSSSYFSDQCSGIFQRMIETVPAGTRLISPSINPTSTTNLKPYGVYLNVDWSGSMTLSGNFRYVQVAGTTAPSSLTVTLVSRDGQTTSTSTTAQASGQDTGTGIFGPTSSYPFTLTFDAATGISNVTANGQTFGFQDTMFVVPSLSSVNPQPPAFSTGPGANDVATYTANLTVAYFTTTPPDSLTATFSIPQYNSLVPSIDTSTTSTLQLIGSANGYSFYSASTTKDLSAKQGYGTSVDVGVAGQAAGVLFFKPFNPAA